MLHRRSTRKNSRNQATASAKPRWIRQAHQPWIQQARIPSTLIPHLSTIMTDIQLTRHFMLSEFTASATASRNRIDNTPSLEVVSNLQYLCQQVLEPLREWMNEPITISSGYRSPLLNKAVGGVSNSQHLTGEAADIHLPTKELGRKYAEFILDHCRFDQMLFETDRNGTSWLHVSCKRDGNRQTYKPIFKA